MNKRVSRRRRFRRNLQIAEFVLLVSGFFGVGWFAYSHLDAYFYQSYENYRIDAMIRGEDPSIAGYFRSWMPNRANDSDAKQPKGSGDAGDRGERHAKRAPMETGSVIGRIELPRINVSTVVREGADDKTLKRAAGHVPYTALPGEHGNVGIAAHRDTFFRNLRGVREGDMIRFKTTWGTYEYIVDSLKIVRPENVEVLDPTSNPSITLVTCYPFNYVGSAPKRYIVRARQVNPAPGNVKSRANTWPGGRQSGKAPAGPTQAVKRGGSSDGVLSD
jgi:sortase A